MNDIILKKMRSFGVLLLMLAGFLSACDESIDLSKTDETPYELPEGVVGFVTNDKGARLQGFTDFRGEGAAGIYLGLAAEAPSDVAVTLKYDAALLEAYNKANETEYALFPESEVTLPVQLSVAKGKKSSDKGEVRFKTAESLETGKTYVIPFRAELVSGDIRLSESESTYLLFVKDLTQLPTADKPSGIKIISCMEVNDTNPLNNLCFTLKSSGKPLIDMVIFFSANINYNAETGMVYVSKNPNIQHLLDNRDKYIKPLQDRGMKVILGILGNHDRSGVANLSDETARLFAQELKTVCDTYGLDGVFFDDEYSKYQYPAPPGFVEPSSAAAARLVYETKKAMPDKLVTVYVYLTTSYLPSVDGQNSGTFIDYGIHDYGGSYDLGSSYPGLPRSGMALYSQEFARGRIAAEYELRRIREEGYGAHMIFAMDPYRSNFNWLQLPSMQRIANVLFDDELVYDGKPYTKDW